MEAGMIKIFHQFIYNINFGNGCLTPSTQTTKNNNNSDSWWAKNYTYFGLIKIKNVIGQTTAPVEMKWYCSTVAVHYVHFYMIVY